MTKAKEKIEEEIKDLVGDKAELEEVPTEAKEIAEKPVKTISKDKRFLTLKQTGEQNWYVIHTYSGYEEQVAESLNQRIESMNMQDKVFDIIVPKEKQIEIKNGKRKIIERKIFPGYVFVNMIVTDDSWYVVRNTPNVTGFIGFGVRPTPVSKEEIDRIKKRMGVEEPKYQIDLRVQDLVKITDGALKGFEGKIEEVDQGKGKLKVLVNMFGRETPVNLDFLQVKKV
ncbi:transcription termination/antitermination protein NusG [Candidatus Berkelbacteria bacterium CG10_big_fil_rev_8_21_14_0_10_43_13]|uniref:Transcription termination/antitermination protein NusG n=1 Tax=Candidatus Berkelbacteria bacterium CG10_big_fil_rev_8_21_14_0_10_43_13 TaxID=1974514 RepID=A0A2H0W6X4_9BACT|nr:MAG: transcription termination/antitermination protein NusG [Candidatus Berkelbacteria bacterium CG10_big_fil_rev_8_21_14_0_10_43_13]